MTVQLLTASWETIPLETRLACLREEHPTANVVAAIDDAEVDFDSPTPWDDHMKVGKDCLEAPVDAAFTCDDYGFELARRLDAEWAQVDPGWVLNPVSDTQLRADPEAFWWALAPCVRAYYANRVVILGWESTGTTTLARALVEELGTRWVEEYGREDSEIRPGGFTALWRTEETISRVGDVLSQHTCVLDIETWS